MAQISIDNLNNTIIDSPLIILKEKEASLIKTAIERALEVRRGAGISPTAVCCEPMTNGGILKEF